MSEEKKTNTNETVEEIREKAVKAEEVSNEETTEVETPQEPNEKPKNDKKTDKKFFGKNDEKKCKEKDTEIEALKAEVEKLKAETTKLKTEYLKAYADTENMQKRLKRDFEAQDKYKLQSFAKEILPVLDNCERAMNVKTEDENYRKAFEMVYKNLTTVLKKEGVEEIECLNQPYDANFHQAMMMEPTEGVEPGIVTAVLQKGYMLKDRLLRAAMVKVSE